LGAKETMKYEIRFIADFIVLSTTVDSEKDEDGAIEVASWFIKDIYGIDTKDIKWNAIDVVVLEVA
jgi:hypothetical protein